MSKRFTNNNVEQCWICQNRDGSVGYSIDEKGDELPYCRVMELAMTEVYDCPCKKFKSIYDE